MEVPVVGDDVTGERSRNLDHRRGSELISRLWTVVPTCAIYAHRLLIDDPVSFPSGPPNGKYNVERLLNNLSYDIAPLARLRVRGGCRILCASVSRH